MRQTTDSMNLVATPAELGRSALSSGVYGWMMVGLAFLIQTIGFSIQYMTVLLIGPLKNSLHASSAAVLLATTSALTLVVAVASPLCGVVVQRYSIRKFVIIAFSAVAVGYCGLAYATSLWQISILYGGAFSVGVLASNLAANTLVCNWFVAHRGLALGIAGAGIPAAGCMIPPLATYAIERFGLIATCLTAAAVIVMLLPVAWLLVIDRPESKGFLPLEMSDRPGAAEHLKQPASAAWTINNLLKSHRFWMISLVGALASGVGSILMVNLMQIAQAANINRLNSSYFASCEAIGAMVGAIGFGKIFDIVSQRAIAQLAVLLTAAPCLLLLGQPNQLTFGIASVLVGLSLGASLLAPNVLIAINFGRAGFAAALGTMNFFIMFVLVISIPMFGAAYDHYHSYDLALNGCLIVLALTLIFAHCLPRKHP